MKKKEQNPFPGYPQYHQQQDIYHKERETDLDPENPSKIKASILKEDNDPQELNFNEGYGGEDLDVSGAELDDAQEDIGSEDEENNFYSLGGDNHQENNQG